MADFHSFNIEQAKEYGMAEAVLLWSFKFWLTKNKANGHNFHEGLYWTYNSIEAYTEMFPYLTASKIRKALAHLEDEGILVSGNFNKVKFDRTKWYALTEKGWELFDESISGNENVHLSENANGIDRNDEPIPVNDQLISPVGKTVNRRFTPPTEDEALEYALSKGYDWDTDEATHFCSYHEMNGWKGSKGQMKSWKAAITTWEMNRRKFGSKPKKQKTGLNPLGQSMRDYIDRCEKMDVDEIFGGLNEDSRA